MRQCFFRMGWFVLACSVVSTGLAADSGPAADNGPAGDTEALPQGAQVAALEVQPEKIVFARPQDYAQVLVTARLDSGETVDATRMADRRGVEDLVEISPAGLVQPRHDGAGELVFALAGRTVRLPVEVHGAEGPLKVDFIHDVMPVLSRLGCNQGTCHGAKNGKNGFKLSLRGYDPVLDTRSLADDLGARRINRASPENSLMLLKATGSVPHVGGQVTVPGSRSYRILRAWIAGGVRLDLQSPRVTRIDLLPENPVIARPGMRQQMRVVATYADGSRRDVTAEAFVSSGNSDVAEAGRAGLVTSLRRGEAPILARFEGAYTATTLTVMGDRTGFVWRQPPMNNPIDQLVDAKLRRVKTTPSPLTTDSQFARRVYLDLTGLPPSVEQLEAFLADERPGWLKRAELIDALIGSPEYVEHWTNKWSDLLQVNRKYLGAEGAKVFRDWIYQQIEHNTPYDQFVYTLLTASGSNREHPAASYFKILRQPAAIMENTTQLFLATRFNCNKCHDHPFERWTQDQYYELAAYFARVGLKPDPKAGDAKIAGTAVEGAKPLYEIVYDRESGEVIHQRTGQVARPKFPYEHEYSKRDGATRREELARWVTSPKNRYFALSMANRIWGYLLGRGIIEPVDDIRAGNPPTNPELLEWLTRHFIESGFDLRDLMRTICNSRTYQRSIATNRWNEDDTINYSHALARRLPAEVLYDAIHRVTGSRPRIPGLPQGTRAEAIPDAGIKLPDGFLTKFGRPPRESSCECERSDRVMLGPVMALINGPTVSEAIADANNAIARLVAEQPDDRQVVERLFLRILNRDPTPKEIEAGVKAIAAAEKDRQRLEAEAAAAERSLDAYRKILPAKLAAWEKTVYATEWFPLELAELVVTNGAALTHEADGSWYLSGKHGKGAYRFKARTERRNLTGIRLEVLADPRLPNRGPGRSRDGVFVLTELAVAAAPGSQPKQWKPLKFSSVQATVSRPGFLPEAAIDGNRRDGGWSIPRRTGRDVAAVFAIEGPSGDEKGTVLDFTLDQQYGDGTYSIGRFRLLATTSPERPRLENPPADLLAVVETPAEKRTDQQQATLMAHYRRADAKLRALEARAAASRKIVADHRLLGAQDIAWALINSPAFLFNR